MLRKGAQSLASAFGRQGLGQIRGLAEAAAEDFPKITPPVQLHGVSGRYATALWCAAKRANELPRVEEEMKQVFTAANENEDFRSFLMDPVTSRKNKMQGMEAMLTDMGMSEVTKRFFMVLAENGRMREAQKVWETFGTLMQAHGKQVKGMVTSAEPLPPGELSEVRESLQKLLGEGETLLLDQKVDPDIIGGLVVELGDKYIDLSVEKRIRDMERLLMEAI